MYGKIQKDLMQILLELKELGLYKNERIITSSQSSQITVTGEKKVLNFCAALITSG